MILKCDALISHFLNIPFPEELDDDVWAIKWGQVQWLAESEILGINKENT